MSAKRPPDFTLVLAVANYGAKLAAADEIAGELKQNFGHDASAQVVGHWLKRLAAQECPPVEARDEGGYHLYSLTRFGRCEIDNKTRGLCKSMAWSRY